ncbi:MAG: hypothetical protein ABI325_01435 [Ginsengibacter sp.]
MKKITLVLMAVCLSLTCLPLSSFAVSAGRPGMANTTPPASARSYALLLRLNEIKNMHKSNLSFSEKKALRKELRTMKHQARSSGSGVFLTVGALLIVILLLILLL